MTRNSKKPRKYWAFAVFGMGSNPVSRFFRESRVNAEESSIGAAFSCFSGWKVFKILNGIYKVLNENYATNYDTNYWTIEATLLATSIAA